jgi:hypothetical protein
VEVVGAANDGLTGDRQAGVAQRGLHLVLVAEVVGGRLGHPGHARAVARDGEGDLEVLQEPEQPVDRRSGLERAHRRDELVGIERVADLVVPRQALTQPAGQALRLQVGDQARAHPGQIEQRAQALERVRAEVRGDEDDVHGPA